MVVRIPIAIGVKTITGTMATFMIQGFAADVPDCIGKKVGVEFSNDSPNASSWIGLDKVRLSVKR
jgi:hypothetical protein